MKLVLDELRKSLRYHQRQLQENLDKIKANEESNVMLLDKSKIHEQTIAEIEKVIDGLAAGKQDQPMWNDYIFSISRKGRNYA